MTRLIGLIVVVILGMALICVVWARLMRAVQDDADRDDADRGEYDGDWRVVDEPGEGKLTVMLIREDQAGRVTGRHIVGDVPADSSDWSDVYMRMRAEAGQRLAALAAENAAARDKGARG